MSLSTRTKFLTPPRSAFALAVVVAAIVVAIAQPWSSGGASSLPTRSKPLLSMFEDIDGLNSNPRGVLQILRSLGVGVVRVPLLWSAVAADPTARTAPAGNAYPDAGWATYDAIDENAAKNGIQINFLLTGGPPLWANGPGEPPGDPYTGVWTPSAAAYGQFVDAAARRYSGNYTPPGASSPLPRVSFWEIWNEPNWGPSLQPQLVLNPVRIASAPEYRQLLDAAWRALQSAGHAKDTVVIGNLSPRGSTAVPRQVLPAAAYQVASPLGFTRVLYCVDSSYHPLTGTAAALAGCPTTAAGSKRFRNEHPALFDATGFGIHPYPVNLPPTQADTTNPDTVEFSQIPHLATALDRVQSAYGSDRRLGIYNTEYGYVTHPPNVGLGYLSPQRAGSYLNWTEYLEWRNSRISSTMQYLLYDPPPGPSEFGAGGFASGLVSAAGQPKADFYAYRMPIWMPLTHAPRGHGLEVWGCARPAPYAYADTHVAQYVQIQFRRGPTGPFSTVRTVPLDGARGCYFDLRVVFPGSGAVRLAWSYPLGDSRLVDPLTPGQTTIYSRSVGITIQ